VTVFSNTLSSNAFRRQSFRFHLSPLDHHLLPSPFSLPFFLSFVSRCPLFLETTPTVPLPCSSRRTTRSFPLNLKFKRTALERTNTVNTGRDPTMLQFEDSTGGSTVSIDSWLRRRRWEEGRKREGGGASSWSRAHFPSTTSDSIHFSFLLLPILPPSVIAVLGEFVGEYLSYAGVETEEKDGARLVAGKIASSLLLLHSRHASKRFLPLYSSFVQERSSSSSSLSVEPTSPTLQAVRFIPSFCFRPHLSLSPLIFFFFHLLRAQPTTTLDPSTSLFPPPSFSTSVS